MKLPSINYLLSSTWNSFLRFPLTIVSAIIAVIVGIYLTEVSDQFRRLEIINLMLVAALGIPLYFCVVCVKERQGFGNTTLWLLNGLSTVILLLIYLSLPDSDLTHNTHQPYIRYAIYNVIVHLFVSFLPFINSSSFNGFWQFNKAMFIRFWASVLYSGVLYLGLVLALGALRLLFDLQVREELYFEIFIVIAGLMNTWFFVSGIPTDLLQLDQTEDYPKGLRIFSEYVLLPLLVIYLIILYVYGGKILSRWEWPNGLVSNLIISIAILGILTFLLLYPYGRTEGHKWIRIASRGYYFALIPLLIILFLAISMRLNAYGLTVSRYIILFLGIWLSLLCIYTALGKTNIRFIPASLAFLLLLISFGPWGIFSASERAQTERLRAILSTAGILRNDTVMKETLLIDDDSQNRQGELLPNEGKLSYDMHNEVYSILSYLNQFHGFSDIRPWFSQNVDSVASARRLNGGSYYTVDETSLYMEALSIRPYHFYDTQDQIFFSYSSRANVITQVSGYDFIAPLHHYHPEEESVLLELPIDSINTQVVFSPKPTATIFVKRGAEKIPLYLTPLIDTLYHRLDGKAGNDLPDSDLQLDGQGRDLDIRLMLQTLNVRKLKDTIRYHTLEGQILIRKRR